MLKIQCPRCKAINEVASADEPCWKCGTILGAPLSALDDAGSPASSAANGADRVNLSAAALQTSASSLPDENAAAIANGEEAGGEKR